MVVESRTDMRSGLVRLKRVYDLAVTALAAAAMGIIVVVMGVQVFARYGLNESLIWAEELCRYLLIVITFLLIGPAFERGEMASIRFVLNLLPRRAAQMVLVPIHLVMIGFLLVVAYFGYRFATFNARFSMPAIDFILSAILQRQVSGALSMYWLYLLIPVGCLILSGHLFAAMLRSIRAAAADRVR